MATNITLSNGGIVRSGLYGHIEAHGNVYCEPGVKFQTMNLEGNLVGTNIQGSSLTLNGSIYLPEGTLKVLHVRGRGKIEGHCNIYVNSLNMTGLINTRGRVYATRQFKLQGLIENQKIVVTREFLVCGVAKIDSLIAVSAQIKPIHPRVIHLKDIRWMVRPSRISRIFCHKAELHKCASTLLHAHVIELKEGSFVHKAICFESITTDKTSASVLTLGGAKRIHVAGY